MEKNKINEIGDGEKIYESDISKAFDDVKRVIVNNNKEINIATLNMNYLLIILILRKNGFHIIYQNSTQQCVLSFVER